MRRVCATSRPGALVESDFKHSQRVILKQMMRKSFSAPSVMSVAMAFVLGAVLSGQSAPPGATAPPASTLVTGRVVDDKTGSPVPNTRVTTTANGVGVPVVLADEYGRFSLPVPAERGGIVATKTGYQKHQTLAMGGAPV